MEKTRLFIWHIHQSLQRPCKKSSGARKHISGNERRWLVYHTSIRPVPKNSAPVQHSDFWPISITPVLCRTLGRVVVRTFLYPAILMPPAALHFSDQFAFLSNGLNYCSSHHFAANHQWHAGYEPIRCSYSIRFQQSFWYRSPGKPPEEDSFAEYPKSSVQLASRIF